MKKTINEFCNEWKDELLTSVKISPDANEVAYPQSIIHNLIKSCVSLPKNTYWESHEGQWSSKIWGVDLTAVDHTGKEQLVGCISTVGHISNIKMSDEQFAAAKRISKNFKYIKNFILEQGE